MRNSNVSILSILPSALSVIIDPKAIQINLRIPKQSQETFFISVIIYLEKGRGKYKPYESKPYLSMG